MSSMNTMEKNYKSYARSPTNFHVKYEKDFELSISPVKQRRKKMSSKSNNMNIMKMKK